MSGFKNKKTVAAYFGLFLLISLSLSPLHAQTGKIAGRIIDIETGEGLPGANIVIEGTTLGAASASDGNYYILNVPPGVYTLRASVIGYRAVTVRDVRVMLELTTEANFETHTEVLTGEEIVVLSTRPIIQNDIGGSEVNLNVDEVKSAGVFQSVNQIMTAQVSMNKVSSTTNRIEIRGSDIESSLFLVDGVQQGDPLTNRPNYQINIDAVQEIKVQTGGFKARYGNFQSGIVNVVTKEGGQKYTGSLDGRYSPPGLKHRGPAMHGHRSPVVLPFVDPEHGAFDGRDNDLSFEGWDRTSVEKVKEGEAHYNKPEEMYARWLWRHRSKDSIEKLKQLAAGGLAPNGQPVAIEWGQTALDQGVDNLAVSETGDDPDHRLNVTFGGPVPGLNAAIPSTFFLSYGQSAAEYMYPFPSDKGQYHDREMRARITSWLTNTTKLSAGYFRGNQRGGEGGQGTGVTGRISSDPFRSLDWFNKLWYPNCTINAEQIRQIATLDLKHSFSASTFVDMSLSYRSTDHNVLRDMRNTAYLAGSNERETGRTFGILESGWTSSSGAADELTNHGLIGTTAEAEAKKTLYPDIWNNWQNWAMINIGGYWYDEAPKGKGHANWSDITGKYRMESCGLRNSLTNSYSYRTELNLVSQFDRHNQVMFGIDINRDNMDIIYETIDPSINAGEIDYSKGKDTRVGLFLQDKIEFQGFITTVGLRLDILQQSKFPFIDFGVGEHGNAMAADDKTSGPYSDFLMAGNTTDEKGDFNTFQVIPNKQVSKHQLSPRLEVSHPISNIAKLFFNYGHFYQWQQPFDRYRIRYRTSGGDRVNRYANPGLSTPRTIAYELGYEHNVANAFLFRMTVYYRDINNIPLTARFVPLADPNYRTKINASWEDVRGIESFLQLRRNTLSEYISGWLSLNYMVKSFSDYGYNRIFEDESLQSHLNSTEVSAADVRPILKASVTLHSPSRFGAVIGNWDAGLYYTWRRGPQFTWNPANVPLVENNVRWRAYQRCDLTLSKRLFRTGSMRASVYLDVINLFDQKNMTRWGSSRDNDTEVTFANFAWDGQYWWRNESENYMYSLGYTDENQSKDGKGNFSNTIGVPGDSGGDIDMPAFTPMTYLESRDIFIGLRFAF